MTARDRRFYEEPAPSSDLRTPAQIDRDRILYSPHFLRLAEVTQVRSTVSDAAPTSTDEAVSNAPSNQIEHFPPKIRYI
jgi:dGTP triphosphohydrolase